MPREGLVNGFYFDKEVFGDYMQEQSMIRNAFIVSGAVMHDPVLASMLGNAGNVGTIPMFANVDAEGDALNDDGKTNNTPTELAGKKQTFMAMARMKAWKENTYTRYLTGKSPLHNLANRLVVPYWRNQWEKDLLAIVKGVMGVAEMDTHITDLTVGADAGTVSDANKLDLTTGLILGQKAKGDQRSAFKLFICHSQVATNLRALQLIENVTYYDNILGKDVELPTYNGMIVFETDTGTVDASGNAPKYLSFMLGYGAILTADKAVHNPYDVDYDPETNGGVEKLYTKQAKVLHPDGFSFQVDNIKEESPTREELANSENWKLVINHKNISIAEIISFG